MPKDADLVERMRNGDEDAFAEFVAEHQRAVRSFIAIWAPSRDEADDIAQEVFISALKSIHTFDVTRDLKTWLLGIARNLTRNAWRRMPRTAKAGAAEIQEMLDRHALSVFQSRDRSCLNAAGESRVDALKKCLETLPSTSKDMFMKYFVEDQASAELAETMRTTESTVRATLSRIRRGLRGCIERRTQSESVA
jgi:RNA polymerase sigma-70 factor (ECF subfamily)